MIQHLVPNTGKRPEIDNMEVAGLVQASQDIDGNLVLQRAVDTRDRHNQQKPLAGMKRCDVWHDCRLPKVFHLQTTRVERGSRLDFQLRVACCYESIVV